MFLKNDSCCYVSTLPLCCIIALIIVIIIIDNNKNCPKIKSLSQFYCRGHSINADTTANAYVHILISSITSQTSKSLAYIILANCSEEPDTLLV